MYRIILIIGFMVACVQGFSQENKQSIGCRIGLTSGFEYRVYSNELQSYKFLLGGRENGAVFHVIKEFHQYDLFKNTDRLDFIYGVGLHAGYERWNQEYYNTKGSYYQTLTAFLMGLDGLAGLEYTFVEVPISLGIEAKPYFDLFGQHMFNMQLFDFAFTAKFNF